MSNEYSHVGDSYIEQGFQEELAVNLFTKAAEAQLDRIKSRYPLGDHYEQRIDLIRANTEIKYFMMLWSEITLMTKSNDGTYQPLVLLDDTHFEFLEGIVRTTNYEFYRQNKDLCKHAIAGGMRRGVDAILGTLDPDAIANELTELQSVRLAPWREDLLDHESLEPSNKANLIGGGFAASYETNLPRIIVTHIYPSGEYVIPEVTKVCFKK